MLMNLEKTVQHFLKDAELKRRSSHTLRFYRRSLMVLMRFLERQHITEVEQVTVFHLRDGVEYLFTPEYLQESQTNRKSNRRGRSAVNGVLCDESVRCYVRIWKAFFNWCYMEELVEKNAAARLSLPHAAKRVLHAFTDEHIQCMLTLFDLSTDIGFRDYVIVLLLLDTGLRLSEIAGLHVDDVRDGYVKVFGKGRKEREVGVFPEVGKLLWKYIHKHRKPSDLNETALFLTYRGTAVRTYVIQQLVHRVKLALGVDTVRVSPHTFRHTFAKMYLVNGGDLFKLSRELGHSDIQTTRRYLEDFSSTDARKDHTSYSPISRLQLNKRKRRKQKE